MSGLVFAIVAAIAFGLWTVFHDQASGHINSLFGAIIVSLTAVIIGSIILIPQLKSITLFTNYKGLLFAALAGVFALILDILVLKAYGSGLPVSIGGPIIIGGSVAVAAVIGFFLGDSVTSTKIIGLILVIGGSALLASVS